ncbi:Bgt-50276 [Blumeria graminis f. sp. tritici]|uniref:Bgt-50276 n=1 Tax=Blumeria graminis f. sp. tritici TaxID=62690 RepID=A0A9X9MHS0_BLUGR|nr:Bgt-50276 [Blumeria graminis f. sp. tritici]
MTEFTDICEYLARNPLANILALFLDIYEDSGSKPGNFHTKATKSKANLIAYAALFFSLAPYAFVVKDKDASSQLLKQLNSIATKINENVIDVIRLQPLFHAISEKENEINILNLALDFARNPPNRISLIQRSCRPTSTPSFSKETILRDNDELFSYQTTAPIVEKALQNELDGNVITGLNNFWEIFFLDQDWSDQTLRIWECYQRYEIDEIEERERDDGGNPLIAQTKYLSRESNPKETLKDNFLNQLINPNSNSLRLFPSLVIEDKGSQIRNKYCHTSHNYQIKGTTNNYQVDFLVKSIDVPSNEIHQWKDVRVLGEFTIKPFKDERRNKFLQLSRSVLQIFSTQPLRQFVHGFCLFKNDFELWLFNRSGAYSSGPLSIKDNKDKLVRAISSYLFMSDEELGIYSPFRNVNGRSFLSFSTEKDDQAQDYDINPNPIFKAGTLVSRGTVCYEMSEESAIVKYSWTRTAGKSEIDFMQDACDTEGVVNYLRADRICKTSDHLQGLNFGSAAYSDISGLKPIATGKGEKQPTTPPRIKDRELTRLIVTPRGFRLNSSRTILEFVEGIRDAIMAHQRLFVEKKVLHGDISDGNIILAFVGGRFRGLLIDFDHAVKVEDTSDKHENSYLTGTLKYMALERLEYAAKTENSITRTYYHDLESFFYVFLTGCIEYERRENPKVVVNLQSWCEENIKENFKGKRSDMTYFETDILPKFSNNFDDLKELARKLHKILFGDGQVNFGTPIEYEPVYRDMIGAFDEVIALIRGKIHQ